MKHGKNHFGYTLSINGNMRYKVLRKCETGTGSIYDSQHFDKVFDRLHTSQNVFADRGYASRDREDWREKKGFRRQIQRKIGRNQTLSESQHSRNSRIDKTRARVEHVFAAIDQMAESRSARSGRCE